MAKNKVGPKKNKTDREGEAMPQKLILEKTAIVRLALTKKEYELLRSMFCEGSNYVYDDDNQDLRTHLTNGLELSEYQQRRIVDCLQHEYNHQYLLNDESKLDAIESLISKLGGGQKTNI